MEKKKLLLVSVSVGLFLVIVIGAAILIVSPRNYNDVTRIDELPIAPGTRAMPVAPDSTPSAVQIESAPQITTEAAPQITMTPAPPAQRAVENFIIINGEDAENAAHVERLNNGSTKIDIKIQSPHVSGKETEQQGVTSTNTEAPATPKPAAPAKNAEPAKKPAPKPAAEKTAPKPVSQEPVYWVQAGSFSKKAYADNTKKYLASKQITSVVMDGNVGGKIYYRVRIGPYTTQKEADYWLSLIKSIDGMENSQVWKSRI
jgi:DedD protein